MPTDETLTAVREIGLLRALPERVLARVAYTARLERYRPGEIVILEGEPCRAVFFVVAGRLRVWRSSAEGREQVLTDLEHGQAFNTVPPFLALPVNHATVRALTSATLLAIACDDFVELVRAEPELALAVLRDFADRIVHLVNLVEDLSLRSVRGRLARFLLKRAQGPAAAQRWTQDEIAAHLGTVRDVVGRTLRAFADEGLVRIERQRIVVLDRERLEALAEA